MCEWKPKSYFDNGVTLEWGENISPENLRRMKKGEIFTLMKDGKMQTRVLMDSFGSIREQEIY